MQFNGTIVTLIMGFVAGTAVAHPKGLIDTKAAAQGGFAKDCKGLEITKRRTATNTYFNVNAVCPDLSDSEWKTKLPLNLCLGNQQGKLVWSRRGQFDTSCIGCSFMEVNDNTAKMRCFCEPGHGQGHVTAEIDLNEGIRNQGGNTWCGEEIGSREA